MLICVTGKCGVGKTTAMSYIKECGYKTWIADEYIHEIYKKGNIGYFAIQKAFGDEYVNDKEVDRKKLGKLVFSSHNSLIKLNEITLPLLKDKLIELSKEKDKIFCELAIYINHEKYFKNIFEKVILISSSKQIEKNSLKIKFNGLRKFSTKRVGNSQNPIISKQIKSSFHVDNSSNLKNFKNSIEDILKKI